MTINEACETTWTIFDGIVNDIGEGKAAPFYMVCAAHDKRLSGLYDEATHVGAIEQVGADFPAIPTSTIESLVLWVQTW
jgi:hypothetical protein